MLIPDSKHLKQFMDDLSPLSSGVIAIDSDGFYLGVNQATADFAGLNSPAELVGGTDLDFPWHDWHKLYRKNDLKTEQSKKPSFFIEPARNHDDELVVNELSVRAPLINTDNQVYGVIGIWIPLNNFPYSKILRELIASSEILNLDLKLNHILRIVTQTMQLKNVAEQWKHSKSLFNYGAINFTLREAQCLHYLLNNYPARKTAEKLFISQKTVEFHIAKIKEKINCQDISEITNKAIDEGFIDLMFMSFD